MYKIKITTFFGKSKITRKQATITVTSSHQKTNTVTLKPFNFLTDFTKNV